MDSKRAALHLIVSIAVGTLISLGSTFVGTRSALATYRDIMGCEVECRVTATGWPLFFVRDYTGMSVVNTADISEVIFAGDRFDWLPFVFDVAFWGGACFLLLTLWRRA